LLSAATIGVALLLVVGVVQERFTPPTDPERTGVGARRRLAGMLTGTTLVLLLTLGALRFGMAVLTPVLSLFVKSLTPDHSRVATLAGATLSVTALTSSAAALAAGRLGDRLGLKRVLLVCSFGVAAAYAAQSLAQTTTQLLLMRAVQGVFVGGTMPMATALLARSTPSSRRGAVFGVSNSVTSGARALGPIVGAAVANVWGMRSVFLTTSAIVLAVSIGIGLAVNANVGSEAAPCASKVTEEPASASPS
jgi:DHA1 family multidrug resistance protein-like MFS transporter